MWRRNFYGYRPDWYRLKQDIMKRLRLNTSTGLIGMVMGIAGIMLLTTLVMGFAKVYRNMFLWVSGSRVNEVYWESIRFGLQAGVFLLLFCGSVIIYFIVKGNSRR